MSCGSRRLNLNWSAPRGMQARGPPAPIWSLPPSGTRRRGGGFAKPESAGPRGRCGAWGADKGGTASEGKTKRTGGRRRRRRGPGGGSGRGGANGRARGGGRRGRCRHKAVAAAAGAARGPLASGGSSLLCPLCTRSALGGRPPTPWPRAGPGEHHSGAAGGRGGGIGKPERRGGGCGGQSPRVPDAEHLCSSLSLGDLRLAAGLQGGLPSRGGADSLSTGPVGVQGLGWGSCRSRAPARERCPGDEPSCGHPQPLRLGPHWAAAGWGQVGPAGCRLGPTRPAFS